MHQQKLKVPYNRVMRKALFLFGVLAVSIAGIADEKQMKMVGKAPPALKVDGWLNSNAPLVLSKLKGKVIVLDFWAYW